MDPDLRRAAVDLVDLEGVLLDEKDWDAWLALYDPDAVYWIPAWDDEDTLTEDPDRQISLIYYGTRAGLEDRIYRLRTELSLASSPLPRTVHQVTNHRVSEDGDDVTVRSNWSTHSVKFHEAHTFFGTQEHWLRREGDGLRIRKRKIIVANDRIPNLLDIYSV